MNNINLNLYKYFFQVAKYESYTKAAEELMVSQPSLSYSIKVLEEQLGIKLFKKEKNHVFLTAEGKEIYDKLLGVFEVLDSIGIEGNNITGKITLGLRPAFAEETLPVYMHELNNLYPNLQIDYITGESDQLKKLLYNHEIDVLIDEEKMEGEVSSILAFEDPCIFITHKHNAEVFKDCTIDEKYCINNELLVVPMNKYVQKIMDIYPDFKYSLIRSTPLMLFNLEESTKIGLAPKIILKRELQTNEFIELKTNIGIPKARMYASYIKRLSNKKINAVIEFFKANDYYDLLSESKNN